MPTPFVERVIEFSFDHRRRDPGNAKSAPPSVVHGRVFELSLKQHG